ncbi:roadblock/LC7 domain-containing protein [Streptomyces sp. NPDC060198]|uniref:roadblock/LC7 domain-containing protein n=1 Tax=Streptomyces sp. NPDC060198 TaxID=3347070 RepID=UPI0036658B3C
MRPASAVASGFQGLAKGAGRHFGGGAVLRTMVETEGGFLFVRSAGSNTYLTSLPRQGGRHPWSGESGRDVRDREPATSVHRAAGVGGCPSLLGRRPPRPHGAGATDAPECPKEEHR